MHLLPLDEWVIISANLGFLTARSHNEWGIVKICKTFSEETNQIHVLLQQLARSALCITRIPLPVSGKSRSARRMSSAVQANYSNVEKVTYFPSS